MAVDVLRTPAEIRAWAIARKATGERIGLVPTMGALHAGHESLIAASVANNDATVVSIFVNPTQFAPGEDFEAYPRTWETDIAAIERLGASAVYAPHRSHLYPDGYATYVSVEGLSEGLCSQTRPHFFRGVATVVTKLFAAAIPDRAYFGQKDAQQAAIVKRLARDLDLGVDVIELPIVRESDGLAMSSRNRYLGPQDRIRALALSGALEAGRRLLDSGETNPEVIVETVRDAMRDVDIDYVALVDAETMQPVETIDREVLLAVAANVGPARLIDNLKFVPTAAPLARQASQATAER